MTLSNLWVGMRTRDQHDAETDARIVLIINEDGSLDLLHHTFEEDTQQDDLGRGKANLYEVPDLEVGAAGITPGNLNRSSIRVGTRGGDAWAPEDFFVFGAENDRPIPLALATDIKKVLSTDKSADNGEARISIPIPRINLGDSSTLINQLLVLMRTSGHGTDSPVQLQIVTPSSLHADFDMPPPPANQADQDANQANFYYANVTVPFAKNNLIASSIQLSFGGSGSDSWLPEMFFLFGLVKARVDGEPPVAIVPLVYIPNWALDPLDSHRSEANPLELPILP